MSGVAENSEDHGETETRGASWTNRSEEVSALPRAWRCQRCNYHMLSMDQWGRPLALEPDAFGRPIPIHCARCDTDHTEWVPEAPFDELGDHANIPAAFSSLVHKGVPLPARTQLLVATRESCDFVSGSTITVSTALPKVQAFHCGLCGRRLLRMDAFGNLVPLEKDATGNTVPLECPGCHVSHTEWVVRSLKTEGSKSTRKT